MATAGTILSVLLIALVFQRRYWEEKPASLMDVTYRLVLLLSLSLGIVIGFSAALQGRTAPSRVEMTILAFALSWGLLAVTGAELVADLRFLGGDLENRFPQRWRPLARRAWSWLPVVAAVLAVGVLIATG